MKLNDERVLEAFRLRLAGESGRAIARRFGVSEMYVSQVLRGDLRTDAHPDHPDRRRCVKMMLQLRDSRRDMIYRRVTRGAWDRAIADYKAGHSLRGAAARHGLHWTSLGRHMRQRGVKRRPYSTGSRLCACRDCRPTKAG